MEFPKSLQKDRREFERKLYIKPQVETVKLLPEQTVLGGVCFSVSNGAPAVGTCDPGQFCYTING